LLSAVKQVARNGKCEVIGEISPGSAETAAISRQFSPERGRRYLSMIVTRAPLTPVSMARSPFFFALDFVIGRCDVQ
jgi:hypothetical protein